jgi:hypothetical protein
MIRMLEYPRPGNAAIFPIKLWNIKLVTLIEY